MPDTLTQFLRHYAYITFTHRILTALALAVTGCEAVHKEVAVRLLKCIENGKHVYCSYRQERLVKKTKKINVTISKRKLPHFTDQPQKTPTTILKEKDISSKDVAEAQRSMDIVKERGMDLSQILFHDVLKISPLFDGELPSHTNKSLLVREIEPQVDITQCSHKYTLATHVVVDFMSKIRQMPLTQFPNMGAVIDTITTSASCISQELQFVHFVLDSYIEMSLKERERMRCTDPTTGINIIGMSRDTPIPQQIDKFWASHENKTNLQLLARDIVSHRASSDVTIIGSSTVSDEEVYPANASGGDKIPDLFSWIEEADSRVVVHVDWAVRVKQCKRIIVISNDTDTFALLLHYTPYLQSLSEQDAALAEMYLVGVLAGARSTTTAETFDQLRVETYTGGSAGIDSLPPTSSVIRGYIQQGFFLVHERQTERMRTRSEWFLSHSPHASPLPPVDVKCQPHAVYVLRPGSNNRPPSGGGSSEAVGSMVRHSSSKGKERRLVRRSSSKKDKEYGQKGSRGRSASADVKAGGGAGGEYTSSPRRHPTQPGPDPAIPLTDQDCTETDVQRVHVSLTYKPRI
ncbi:hypothetical protein Pcinc_010238 [Petrolisthes cinctipes]|uniref:Uncharacterized protein n=1 Tax=Petrolisthes cinctipes TaxID=88211 RepID=A0AAE1G5Q1_PETCI|nr:hypothetical protein Pcinc_010238 [Petrolisthes cinctipes]